MAITSARFAQIALTKKIMKTRPHHINQLEQEKK